MDFLVWGRTTNKAQVFISVWTRSSYPHEWSGFSKCWLLRWFLCLLVNLTNTIVYTVIVITKGFLVCFFTTDSFIMFSFTKAR